MLVVKKKIYKLFQKSEKLLRSIFHKYKIHLTSSVTKNSEETKCWLVVRNTKYLTVSAGGVWDFLSPPYPEGN